MAKKIKTNLKLSDQIRILYNKVPSDMTLENFITFMEANLNVGGGALPSNYKIVACVLRNTGSGWFAIDDATHAPLNIDSVSDTATAVNVDYTSLGATEVVYGAAIADETFAGIYDFGTSVGLTSTGIVIKAIPRKIQILVTLMLIIIII